MVGTEAGFGVLRDPIACKPAVMAETDRWVAFGTEYRALVDLPGVESGARVGAGAGDAVSVGTALMPTVDLAGTPLRELNAALHRLAPDTNETHWRVLNPRGRHAVAAGIDAPVTVEIDGHVGYYCAGMNKHATVIVHGNAGQGVAENMMSGQVRVKGDASQAAGATGCGGLLVIDGNASARCGISMKGIDIVVKGSVGHLSAFMAQAGNLVVLGDAGEALGDFDLRGAPLRARHGEESRRRLHREAARGASQGASCASCSIRPASTASTSASSAATARRGGSIISTSTMSDPTDDRAGPLDPHAAAQVGDLRRPRDRGDPPGGGDRHLRHPRRRAEAQAAAFR